MLRQKEIEKSIIKRFRKEIWKKFTKAIISYELIKNEDKIAVCISGGKDSMLLAKCFQELQKHGKVNFELIFLVMDPGYTKKTLNKINENASIMGINLKIFKSDIFKVVDSQTAGAPCYLCARMRRGFLYAKAQELGCNKIALGHHFDDVIETTLLSMFYNGEFKTMLPKLKSTNFNNMELIRPLYYVREKDINSFALYNELEFINCACMYTENISRGQVDSKRQEMKQLIKQLENTNSVIPANIFRSLENVNLETVLGYKKEGKKNSYLDNY